MTALIVVGALVLVVLAIGSAALPERSRGDAGRTSRRRPARPAGTPGARPSPLVELLGHAIEAAADDGASRGIGGGAPRARTEGEERDAVHDRPHHACGLLPATRPDRAEHDDAPPRDSGSSGDSGGWSWGGSDD